MFRRPLPSWDGVLTHISKLRTLAVHLKAENPEPEDFLPYFGIMSDFVLGYADEVSEEARSRASILINEILIEHGYLDAAER